MARGEGSRVRGHAASTCCENSCIGSGCLKPSHPKQMRGDILADTRFMRLALRHAARGYGQTSPNPMVGAVLVKDGKVIGQGWHHRAGDPHAEIEAIGDAQKKRASAAGATLYVTLEPCSTHGRTPPCTEAIKA